MIAGFKHYPDLSKMTLTCTMESLLYCLAALLGNYKDLFALPINSNLHYESQPYYFLDQVELISLLSAQSCILKQFGMLLSLVYAAV